METDWFLEDMREWMINNPLDESDTEELIRVPPSSSAETRKMISESLKEYFGGQGLPEETKRKLRNSLKGRKFSEQHLQRKSEAQKRKVIFNGIVYNSGREAAEALGVSPACIVKWAKNGKGYYTE